jgi:hypothetical protein
MMVSYQSSSVKNKWSGIVAGSRQYRQGDSRYILPTWTSTTVGTIGAFVKIDPYDRLGGRYADV